MIFAVLHALFSSLPCWRIDGPCKKGAGGRWWQQLDLVESKRDGGVHNCHQYPEGICGLYFVVLYRWQNTQLTLQVWNVCGYYNFSVYEKVEVGAKEKNKVGNFVGVQMSFMGNNWMLTVGDTSKKWSSFGSMAHQEIYDRYLDKIHKYK